MLSVPGKCLIHMKSIGRNMDSIAVQVYTVLCPLSENLQISGIVV